MARRKAASKRTILPDPLFGSEVVAKFVNVVMINGKKSVAEKIVYGALNIVAEKKLAHKNISDAKALAAAAEVATTAEVDPNKGKSKKVTIKKNNIRTDANLRAVALNIFNKCLDELSPVVEVRSRRVGGANYQVPVEVRKERGMTLAMRWLVNFAQLRSEKTMVLKLANEILDVLSGRGGAVKKRETVYSMAKANQAFAHFRW